MGIHLSACGWRVDVFQEEALREKKPLAKGTMEFFLILARLACQKLELPVAIGGIGLGQRLVRCVRRDESVAELRQSLLGWASWRREDVLRSQVFFLPLPLTEDESCREWLLLTVTSSGQGEALSRAVGLRVTVADRSGRLSVATRVAKLLGSLIHVDEVRAGGEEVAVERAAYPVAAGAASDSTLAVLGMVFARLGRMAGVAALDVASANFVAEAEAALVSAFRNLRAEADARGSRAVEEQFKTRESCLAYLSGMGAGSGSVARRSHGGSGSHAPGASPSGSGTGTREMGVVRMLSWNIAGEDLSCSAPASWSVADKMFAVKAEIARLRPDILALQENPGALVSPVVPDGFDLVGSVEGHPAGCFVQLYGRAGLGLVRVNLPRGAPAVMGRCEVGGVGVAFVSAHLFPHEGNEAERARQLRLICSARGRDAIVVLGDLNVRRDEVQTLCEGQGLRDMVYSGSSWSPTTNRFYENLADYRGAGYSFDRILSAGDVWVEGHLVGACRTYFSGKGFFLSDHFGLLGLLDVHAAYGTAGGGDSGVARRRREALGSYGQSL